MPGGSELDGEGVLQGGGCGDVDAGATVDGGAAHFAFAAGGEQAGFLHLEGYGEGGCGGGLVEEEDGEALLAVFALGEADLLGGVGIERTCGIDGGAVEVEPGAHLFHAFEGLGRKVALGVRAHIEQEVAAFGHHIGQHVDELGGGFVMVGGDVGPAVAHGHAGLPGVGQQGVGHLFFGGAVVFVAAAHGAVDDDEVGVVGAGDRGEGGHVDVLHALAAAEPGARLVVDAPFGAYPTAVEPEDVDIAVVVGELTDLVVGKAFEIIPTVGVVGDVVVDVAVGGGPFGGPVVAVVPVGFGEVEAGPEALGTESIDEVERDVGLWVAAVGAVGTSHPIVALGAAEHAETVVVLGGEDHVFHAGVFGGGGYGCGVELGGVESFVEGLITLFVFVVGHSFAVDPGFGADAP